MTGVARGTATLVGAAAAGVLIWTAAQVEGGSPGDFWRAMGLLAAAGVPLGLTQAPLPWAFGALRIAFLPAALVAAWVLLATQPVGGWQQSRLEGWSDSIGVLDVVRDLGVFASILAFGAGVLLGLSAFVPIRRRRVVEPEPVAVPDEDVHDYAEPGAVGRVPEHSQEGVDVRDPVLGNLPPERTSRR